MWTDHTRSSSSPKSHRTEPHAGRARRTPTGTILHRNPEIPSAAAVLEWSTLPSPVFTVPSRVCARRPTTNSPKTAPHFRRCSTSRTPATAAPNLPSRRPRAGHIPSRPENTVVAVPPHSECAHPQPASFSSAPHSHTVHPKPTAAPCTRVETTRHNTAMINRHRDGHPSRQQWGARRPRHRRCSLRSAGVSPYVAALSRCQIEYREGARRAPSLGPIRRHRAAPTAPLSASVVFRPPTSVRASSVHPCRHS